MNARDDTVSSDSMPAILRGLLWLEAVGGLVATIALSLMADQADASSETAIRFAAGGTFLLAILAAAAARGVRRRLGWAWTLSAILQLVTAVGTGLAVLNAEWHPALLAGFALPAIVMLVLSTASVREALGQP